jgi:hypothetical protein
VTRASHSQCRSRNIPVFDPSILRHREILGAADEAVLNKGHKNKKSPFLHILASKSNTSLTLVARLQKFIHYCISRKLEGEGVPVTTLPALCVHVTGSGGNFF